MKKVLGIGNALVDILIQIPDDNELVKYELPKGSMQLVGHLQSEQILASTLNFDRRMASGGSAANTVHGLAGLGAEVGYVGRIGNDETGLFFKQDLEEAQITPYLYESQTETGRAIAMISPDSERTFATYLGAAVEMTREDLVSDVFKEYDILHIEGYLVQNNDLIEAALKLAHQNNMKVSLDMASYNVVEDNLDFLKRLVRDYVDILFANEEEARAFTGKDPQDALDMIAKDVDIAVVKVGTKGSWIRQGDQKYHVDVIDVSPVDTTGAGDLYASGFLFGYCNDLSPDESARIGTILAGKVIEHLGAKLPVGEWPAIADMIRD
jgi:sugar/nucleoside kinase (ribokinase family)